MKRRTFLFGGAAAAGGLVLGYRSWVGSFDRAAVRQVQGEGEHLLAGWIKIGADDTVTIYIPHVDMGQGTHTALAMLAAEELDADWARVRTERAPAEKTFANRFLARGWIIADRTFPLVDGLIETVFVEAARQMNLQITGGSTAVRMTGRFGMRQVGAAAKFMLISAAAERWGVPAARLTVRDGVVTDATSGRSARFGELAEAAARQRVPADAPLKKPADWRLVGTSPGRLDIPAKTDGSFAYGIDFTLPDMLHAAVRSAPVHGGRLIRVDPAPAREMPGVVRVLTTERAVAVVAASWWQARQALDTLAPEFDGGGARITDAAGLAAEQDRALASEGESLESEGAAEAALASAPPERLVEVEYRVPYLHHAAMEPVNLTARFEAGRLTVWGGEQDALGAKARLVELSGLSWDAVTFHGLATGGSFGRRIAPSADYMEHVAPIARALSPRPVKLILSREEEFAQGTYRPALATRISGSLAPDGRPEAWSQAFLAAPTRNDGFPIPYAIPNRSIRSIDFATHVRTGTWRAVAHTQHAFWTESFIDELAHAARRDPYEYRRDLLPEGSRERRVLEAAAEMAGWGLPPEAGRARGIALAESYGTLVAEVVEISMPDGAEAPSVHRVFAAVDCGTVVHPDTARQQVEGAIVMGLSAALFEEITLSDGAVAQSNFYDYRILTLAETPQIEVRFLHSDAAWGGLGEPGLPPVAPTLANALFALTGRRVRSLPIARALVETA